MLIEARDLAFVHESLAPILWNKVTASGQVDCSHSRYFKYFACLCITVYSLIAFSSLSAQGQSDVKAPRSAWKVPVSPKSLSLVSVLWRLAPWLVLNNVFVCCVASKKYSECCRRKAPSPLESTPSYFFTIRVLDSQQIFIASFQLQPTLAFFQKVGPFFDSLESSIEHTSLSYHAQSKTKNMAI